MNLPKILIGAAAVPAFWALNLLPPTMNPWTWSSWSTVAGSACEVFDPDFVGGTVTWSGACADGLIVGNGELRRTWPDGFWIRYRGTMEDGMLTGQGSYETSEGDKYVGEFAETAYHGHGTLTLPGHVQYEGDFDYNAPVGAGQCRSSDGKTGRCRIDDDFSVIWLD